MKKLSAFDLSMIIAFVVVTLLGGGAWWYLSGQLQAAEQDVGEAHSDFDKYSTKVDLVVEKSNIDILHANIGLLKAQLDPLIPAKLLPKDSKLALIEKNGPVNPVDWKHGLDDKVKHLTAEAQVHGVVLPPSFYFAFSRYLNQNPNDQQTLVLSKQLLGVEEIATILINAPVKAIQAIRRTYEEDPRSSNSGGGAAATQESDHINGSSTTVGGGLYTAYPFEVEFDITTENFRKVINGLVQAPDVFVIRSLTVQNSQPTSPQLGDLDKLAGPAAPSVVDSSPGATAVSSTKPPQFLFGNATLHVKARVDLIEWNTPAPSEPPALVNPPANPPSPGGN